MSFGRGVSQCIRVLLERSSLCSYPHCTHTLLERVSSFVLSFTCITWPLPGKQLVTRKHGHRNMSYTHSSLYHSQSISSWDECPCSYLQYLEICSKALRACLKPDIAANAAKRGDSGLKYAVWENGKQGELSKGTLPSLLFGWLYVS